jgi:nitrite reductase/ring-hydroxylating ferredoxin subunit
MPKKILCNLDDLPVEGAKGLSIAYGEMTREIFLVRTCDNVYGYINSCPHTGSPLDWMPDQFLNSDKTYIQCATHNALFRIEDGFCVAGPCVNMSLQPIPVKLENHSIVLLN